MTSSQRDKLRVWPEWERDLHDESLALAAAISILTQKGNEIPPNAIGVQSLARNWLSQAIHHLTARFDIELRGGRAAFKADHEDAAAIVKTMARGLGEAADDLLSCAKTFKELGQGTIASKVYEAHVRARDSYQAIAGEVPS